MSPTDIDALERAIADARAEGPARNAQIAAKLQDESWTSVGQFASYCRQTETLHLEPWQTPPVWIGSVEAASLNTSPDDGRRTRDAALLLKKMLALGISRYEPDPPNAIAAAEARRQPCPSP